MTVCKNIFYQIRISNLKNNLINELKYLVDSIPAIHKKMDDDDYHNAVQIISRCEIIKKRYTSLDSMSWGFGLSLGLGSITTI